MATETIIISSDSDDKYVTDVHEHHKKYMKSKLINCLYDTDDYAVQILHNRGQPAQMIFRLGSTQEKDKPYERKVSNKILVKDIPKAYFNEEYIQMFFEYTKGQGGGLVRTVELKSEQRSAVVEFEKTESVNTVLMKQPIRIMGTEVGVEVLYTYLDTKECLDSLNIVGLEESFGENVKSIEPGYQHSELLDQRSKPEIRIGDLQKKLNAVTCENRKLIEEIDKLNGETIRLKKGLDREKDKRMTLESSTDTEVNRLKREMGWETEKVNNKYAQMKKFIFTRLFLDIIVFAILILVSTIHGGLKAAVCVLCGCAVYFVIVHSIASDQIDEFRTFLQQHNIKM